MGAGELDGEGNVNATKMGALCTGAGGFIDITQNAKRLYSVQLLILVELVSNLKIIS